MLIASGAEICAISTKYEERKIKQYAAIPKLPQSDLFIYNAISERKMKIYKQVLIPIKIGNVMIHTTFIIIPKLNTNGIIGNGK